MSAAEKRVALEVSDLACGYGGRAVLEHVSFSVPRGRAVMLLGPNGVGKTTLFKTVLGFLPRLAGSVLVEGEEVRGWTRQALCALGRLCASGARCGLRFHRAGDGADGAHARLGRLFVAHA